MTAPRTPLYCSFCGKSDEEVLMLAGPCCFICTECVDLCASMRCAMILENEPACIVEYGPYTPAVFA